MARMPKLDTCVTIDFETHAIEDRPRYPPEPVGLAVKWPGRKKPVYFAWGHATDNNCTKEDAVNELRRIWASDFCILMHNGKFDIDVAETRMGMPKLDWRRYHDTMFALFLLDPHATSLALKESAEVWVGMPPEERDELKEWILANVPEAKKKPSTWGAYIWRAPGTLAGRYAIGDVVRTDAIYTRCMPEVLVRGMGPAYDRERQILHILLNNERQGIHCDYKELEKDLGIYRKAVEDADAWLRKRLQAPDLNVDSNDEFAKLLDFHGIVTEWEKTKTGKNSTAKKNLTVDKFNDKKVAQVYGYRNRAMTCITVFMETWLEMAQASGGIIYTNWNQVRQSSSSGDFAGARTGRMSSNPNFMNIPKGFEDKGDDYEHPAFLKKLPLLPLMRKYILPDPGQLFLHRDYNQQELRILAHFEDGALCAKYQAEPRMDIHTLVQGLIAEITGHTYPRGPVKIINFGKVYGMGVGKLAMSIKSTVEDAKRLSDAHRAALPGVSYLEKEIKAMAKRGEPVTTWGGRQYYVEDPKFINGRWQTYEYKLLNYLIQGSAADCTKEAIIRYNDVRKDSRFMLTVHDEINLSCPEKAVKKEMTALREAMFSVEFDVPMVSDGKIGPRWGSLTKYEEA